MSLGADQLAQLNTLIYQEGMSNAYKALGTSDMRVLLQYMKSHAGRANQHDGYISDEQYRALIDHALNDPEIAGLSVKDLTQPGTNGQTSRNLTLVNRQTNDMYIVFKGTQGSTGEWGDNFKGLYEYDTPNQRAASAYVDQMVCGGDYHVTVTGHSKGGNKAMYVAVTNPNVDECYSFDGQGFSRNFMNKYASQIAARKAHIHAYDYEGDFVSALPCSVAGDTHFLESGQDHEGFGSALNWLLRGDASFLPRNHAPMMLFSNSKDFRLDSSGRASGYWKTINHFTLWIMDNVPAAQQRRIAGLIGACADDPSHARDYIRQHPEELGMLVAAIGKYPHAEDLLSQLAGIGLAGKVLAALLLTIVRSGARRPWAMGVLARLLGADSEWAGRFGSALKSTEGDIDSGVRRTEVVAVRQEEIRDWSDERMQELLDIVAQVDAEPWWDITRWDIRYRFENLVGRLDVERYRNDMETYLRKQIDMNDVSREVILAAFRAAEEHQARYAGEMDEIASQVARATSMLDEIRGRLSAS
ncbi:hypothetical protein HMPREF1008_01043 [Olsenella sp. oral taxon 809 str. F0356]|uniref:Mbeg1-like protein n=1 Tax=Olsenella sp. oral taxon 809 TaxID=661086 RepID=UPI000231EDDC|nr:Mbeg1-like protein [Olsenella sp. oral taxon 809]EHF01948.1 hypothetical protein HMPREF1008_01043 [Olsenella sp. oral taxon 809 str. F0356]